MKIAREVSASCWFDPDWNADRVQNGQRDIWLFLTVQDQESGNHHGFGVRGRLAFVIAQIDVPPRVRHLR